MINEGSAHSLLQAGADHRRRLHADVAEINEIPASFSTVTLTSNA